MFEWIEPNFGHFFSLWAPKYEIHLEWILISCFLFNHVHALFPSSLSNPIRIINSFSSSLCQLIPWWIWLQAQSSTFQIPGSISPSHIRPWVHLNGNEDQTEFPSRRPFLTWRLRLLSHVEDRDYFMLITFLDWILQYFLILQNIRFIFDDVKPSGAASLSNLEFFLKLLNQISSLGKRVMQIRIFYISSSIFIWWELLKFFVWKGW